jgi:hypothetical protein
MSSMSEKSAFEAFARMEERIEQNERQLKAAQEIDEEFTGDKLANEFKQLERGSVGGDADSRLLALKQKMGMLPAPAPAAARALGPGDGARSRRTAPRPRPRAAASTPRRGRAARRVRGAGEARTVSVAGEARGGEGGGAAPGGARRLRFAPLLAATVLTVLLLWLVGRAADVLLLLFLAVLLSLYLGAVADFVTRRTRLPRRASLALAVLATAAGLVGLLMLLVPPVVEQTQALVKVFPNYVNAWDAGLDRLMRRVPGLGGVFKPGEHRIAVALYEQGSTLVEGVVRNIGSVVHATISIVSVGVMSIYLALHPSLYREWMIALFPPSTATWCATCSATSPRRCARGSSGSSRPCSCWRCSPRSGSTCSACRTG